MSIAVSIFLSALFLGCVFLYIKSESKEKWRKYLLFLIGIPFVVFVSIFLYLIIDEQIEKRSYKTEPQKDTSKFPTHMKGIRLGETLSNLQFEHGKFRKLPYRDGRDIYIAPNDIWIFLKNDKADELIFNCPSNPFEDMTYFHLIRCYDSSKQVLKVYGEKEVKISCSDTDVETRLYQIPNRKVSLILRKDAVVRIHFHHTQVEPPKIYTKDC